MKTIIESLFKKEQKARRILGKCSDEDLTILFTESYNELVRRHKNKLNKKDGFNENKI